VAYALLDEMKIIDLGWPLRSLATSTVGYPSDSWVYCITWICVCVRCIVCVQVHWLILSDGDSQSNHGQNPRGTQTAENLHRKYW